MKSGLLFTLTTGGLSILFLVISAQFMKVLSAETTSYLFWFFIICTVIGIMIFPFAAVLIRASPIGRFWKILLYFGLGLLILNFPFGAQENKWITIDVIRDLYHPRQEAPPDFAYTIGVFHLLPMLALGLSLFFFRHRLLNPPTEPRPS
jgi:hypothetical protein